MAPSPYKLATLLARYPAADEPTAEAWVADLGAEIAKARATSLEIQATLGTEEAIADK